MATATVGGSAVNATIARAGQRARITFSGTAGQRIDLGMTHTFSGVTTAFRTADEATTLVSQGISSPGELHSPLLPSTGTYLLMVKSSSAATGSVTATLSAEVTGTITIGGSSTTVAVTRAGQRARVTFTGTSGQSISLGITSATVSGTTTLYRPDASVHNGPTGYSTPSGGVDYAGLLSTGTRELIVDPSGVGTGDVTLTLSELIAGTGAERYSGHGQHHPSGPGGLLVVLGDRRPALQSRDQQHDHGHAGDLLLRRGAVEWRPGDHLCRAPDAAVDHDLLHLRRPDRGQHGQCHGHVVQRSCGRDRKHHHQRRYDGRDTGHHLVRTPS